MKILLDTHILLWTVSNDSRLPLQARTLIEDAANQLFFSDVSLWETEIKHLLHPDLMTIGAEELAGYCRESGFLSVSIHETHIFYVEKPLERSVCRSAQRSL